MNRPYDDLADNTVRMECEAILSIIDICRERVKRGFMNTKKEKWLPIMEILFTYLAINKIVYWINTITAMNRSDLENVGEAVLMRLLYQDLILIIGVVAFFIIYRLLEMKKSKYSSVFAYVMLYVVGFIAITVIAFIYNLIMNLIFSAQDFSLGAFTRVFISFMPSLTIYYIIVAVVLEIKHYFKTKGKKATEKVMPIQSTEDKIAMLKVLLDDDILTQEEFDCKKEKLQTHFQTSSIF